MKKEEELQKVLQEIQKSLYETEQLQLPIMRGLEKLDKMLVRIYLQELCVITDRAQNNEQCEKCEFIQMLAFMMDRSISERILKSIKEALDTLDYNPLYILDSHYCPDCMHDGIVYFFKVQFRTKNFHKDTPLYWKEDVEKALANVVEEYHGNTHWEDDIFVIIIEKRYNKDRF